MDTSKKYNEDKIRDFNKYRRRRTLAQFCKDDGVDYDWMLKTNRKYSGRAQQASLEEAGQEEYNLPSLIALHYGKTAKGRICPLA
ncbi:MAG: hypothetical protein HDS46_05985 [Bacteroides sp.]|nr:hypothetical protein [Bacteroides sp.]